MRRGISAISGLVSALFLVCSLGAWTGYYATSPAAYQSGWDALAVYGAAGVAPAEAPTLAQSLTDALRTGDMRFMEDQRATVFGREQAAWNQREIHHMRDVSAMLAPWPWVTWITALCLLLFVLGGAYCIRRSVFAAWVRGACRVLLELLALLVLIGVWAAVDFASLFLLFHQVAFTNDLWLLNPATDLLIRLMPQAFFMRMVVQIALSWAGTVALLTGGTALASFIVRKRQKVREGI